MPSLKRFCKAFEENDTAAIEKGLTSYLRKTICIRDANAKKEMKESFYHGILLGLFTGMNGWKVRSNAESGEGYSERNRYHHRIILTSGKICRDVSSIFRS